MAWYHLALIFQIHILQRYIMRGTIFEMHELLFTVSYPNRSQSWMQEQSRNVGIQWCIIISGVSSMQATVINASMMWMLAHQYLNSWHVIMHLLWHFASCCSCKLCKLWGAEAAADPWLGITWCWNRPCADNSSRKIKRDLQLLCVSFPPFPWCLWCVYQHARYNILFL